MDWRWWWWWEPCGGAAAADVRRSVIWCGLVEVGVNGGDKRALLGGDALAARETMDGRGERRAQGRCSVVARDDENSTTRPQVVAATVSSVEVVADSQ